MPKTIEHDNDIVSELLLNRIQCMRDVNGYLSDRIEVLAGDYDLCCPSSSSESSSSSSSSTSSSSSSSTSSSSSSSSSGVTPCDCEACDQINLQFTYDGDPALMDGAFSPTTNIEAVKIDPSFQANLAAAFPIIDWCHYELQGVTYVDTTYDRSWIVVPREDNINLMQHVHRETVSGNLAVHSAYTIADECNNPEGVFINEFSLFDPNRIDTMTVVCSSASYSSSSSGI